MHHEMPLISTIVAGLGLAFLFGALAHRVRISPIVGYLIAGVLVGPFTPGFVADQELAVQLAEIGVILLMFGVGLHFSLEDLMSVRNIAVPGAIAQIGAATLLGLGLALLLGWTPGAGLVFGLALSVASTVVLLRAMQERRLMETSRGRIAVGWLIVEDLAMVLALVLLPAVAGLLGGGADAEGHHDGARFFGFELHLSLPAVIGLTVLKVTIFLALMLVVGRRVIPWILHHVAHSGSRELFRLAVLAIALVVAYGAAQLFDVSLALGAFFAGMVMSESPLSQRATQETLPLRDAFAVLFFVSVGMLFNPATLWTAPLPLLGTLLIILVGKSVVAYMIVRAFGYSRSTALTISASLAQIGEFSFILAELGIQLNLLPSQGRDLILAGAILSILVNPLLFGLIDRVGRKPDRPAEPEAAPAAPPPAEPSPAALSPVAVPLASAPKPALEPATPPAEAPAGRPDEIAPPDRTRKTGHAIVIGHGRVGSLIAAGLAAQGVPYLVVELSEDRMRELSAAGVEVIAGNAAQRDTLEATNPAAARCLVVAIPETFEAGQVGQQVRAMNPDLHIVARAHSDAEVAHLTALGADTVVMGEREIARGMLADLAPVFAAAPAAALNAENEPAAATPVAARPDETPAEPAADPDPARGVS